MQGGVEVAFEPRHDLFVSEKLPLNLPGPTRRQSSDLLVREDSIRRNQREPRARHYCLIERRILLFKNSWCEQSYRRSNTFHCHVSASLASLAKTPSHVRLRPNSAPSKRQTSRHYAPIEEFVSADEE